jgi:hypothetical protein
MAANAVDHNFIGTLDETMGALAHAVNNNWPVAIRSANRNCVYVAGVVDGALVWRKFPITETGEEATNFIEELVTGIQHLDKSVFSMFAHDEEHYEWLCKSFEDATAA